MREPSDGLNEVSGKVIGAAIEVHRCLGPGFPEKTYGDALAVELTLRGIEFRREAAVEIRYKDVLVFGGLVDFLVGGALIVEIKAVEAVLPVHSSQVVAYLRATGLDLGLLLNFNVPSL